MEWGDSCTKIPGQAWCGVWNPGTWALPCLQAGVAYASFKTPPKGDSQGGFAEGMDKQINPQGYEGVKGREP